MVKVFSSRPGANLSDDGVAGLAKLVFCLYCTYKSIMQRRVNFFMLITHQSVCYDLELYRSAACCRAHELLQTSSPFKQVQDLRVPR